MKITKRQLRRIIKEEKRKVIAEARKRKLIREEGDYERPARINHAELYGMINEGVYLLLDPDGVGEYADGMDARQVADELRAFADSVSSGQSAGFGDFGFVPESDEF